MIGGRVGDAEGRAETAEQQRYLLKHRFCRRSVPYTGYLTDFLQHPLLLTN